MQRSIIPNPLRTLLSYLATSSLPTDQPIVASFPHFFNRPGPWMERLEGLHGDRNKHQSYITVEPTLGVPLNQRACSQSNLRTSDLSGFKADIARFSEMVIPMFWLDIVRVLGLSFSLSPILISLSLSLATLQYMKEVTPVITKTVYFIVNTLPKIQFWISGSFIILGLSLLMMGCWRLQWIRNSSSNNNRDENKETKAKSSSNIKNGK